MAEMETEEEELTEVVEENEEYTPQEEYTYEEVVEMATRLKKAEASLIEKKREAKAQKQKEPAPKDNAFITKDEMALERFVDKNPEMDDYRDELKGWMDKGVSLTQAKLLVENGDKAIQNKKKMESMNISSGIGSVKQTVFTRDQLTKMTQGEYNNVRDMMKAGKAIVKD